jgi:hypothetical protein
MTTIGETVSRVRGTVKGEYEDALLTDRYIWSVITKYAKAYIRRQDTMKKLLKFRSFFVPLTCVDLIETDKIEACCAGIKTGCIIMRTKEKLPVPFEGPIGPMFRTVSSIDNSQEIYQTTPGGYTTLTKTSGFKFNNTKYYWYLNGYMYFPNIDWPKIKIEGVWDGDISAFICDENAGCGLRQDQQTNIPEDLFALIENDVRTEILGRANIPGNQADDKNNIHR